MNNMDFFPKIERPAANAANAKSSGTAKAQAKKGEAASLFADALGDARSESKEVRNKSDQSDKRAFSVGADSKTAARRPLASEDSRIDRWSEASPVRAVTDGAMRTGAADQRSSVEEVGERRTLGISDLEVVDATREQKAVLKQQAVLEFMDGMQAKFGVAPATIISAFAQLDEKTLGGRPEDAMAQLLAQLQIPAGQMKDAEAMYQKMVQATGESALNERLGVGKKVVNLEILAPKEQRRVELNSSLDTMSDKFFRRGQLLGGESTDGAMNDPLSKMGFAQSQQGVVPGLEQGVDTSVESVENRNESSSGGENKTDGKGLGLGLGALTGAGLVAGGAMKSASGTTAQAMTAAAQSSAGSAVESVGHSLSEEASEFGATEESMDEFLAGDGGNGQSLAQNSPSAMNSADTIAGFGASLAGAGAAASKAVAAYAGSADDSKQAESEVNVDTGQPNLNAVGTGPSQTAAAKAANLSPSAMILQGPQASSEQQQENINEIIRQAQVVMKRGGGEMKIQLTPEGLGQVNLKVNVQDGQVNVQMMTENDAAKKLLENGLTDLKAQLAAHKLHVETLKVDMQSDAGMKKFEQNFGEQQREQARQFASDFMGQFRDERQHFYSNFMDRPGTKGYGRSQKRASIEPTPADGVQAANSRGGNGGDGSRRLNLVA